jgi:hypothetical protein
MVRCRFRKGCQGYDPKPGKVRIIDVEGKGKLMKLPETKVLPLHTLMLKNGKKITSTRGFYDDKWHRHDIFVTREGMFFLVIPKSLSLVLYGIVSSSSEKRKGDEFYTNKVENYRNVIECDTLEGLKEKFESELRRYKEIRTTKEKYIYYVFNANVFIMGEDDTCLVRREDVSFSQSPTLELWYEVGYIHEVDGNKEFRDEHGKYIRRVEEMETRSKNWGYVTQGYMPWTEQREKFFANQVEFLKKLIHAAHDFLNQDHEKKLSIMDSGQLLLPGEKK